MTLMIFLLWSPVWCCIFSAIAGLIVDHDEQIDYATKQNYTVLGLLSTRPLPEHPALVPSHYPHVSPLTPNEMNAGWDIQNGIRTRSLPPISSTLDDADKTPIPSIEDPQYQALLKSLKDDLL